MSKTPGAFGGGPKSAPTPQPAIFDESDRLIILTPVFAYQTHDAMRACVDHIRATIKGRFRQSDGSVRVQPLVAAWITLPNDSHIDRARNTLTHIFLGTPYRFCLWWDADVEATEHDVQRIWQHLMHGRSFVAGLYAMKTIVPTFVANIVPGAQPDPESGLIELIDAGTGFLGLDRAVFSTLRHAQPDLAFTAASNAQHAGETLHAYFGSGPAERPPPYGQPGKRDWLSEDWMLCHRWQLTGGKVWGDVSINLHHWGPMRFPPSIGDLAAGMLRMCQGSRSPIPEHLRAPALQPLQAIVDWCRQPPSSP